MFLKIGLKTYEKGTEMGKNILYKYIQVLLFVFCRYSLQICHLFRTPAYPST